MHWAKRLMQQAAVVVPGPQLLGSPVCVRMSVPAPDLDDARQDGLDAVQKHQPRHNGKQVAQAGLQLPGTLQVRVGHKQRDQRVLAARKQQHERGHAPRQGRDDQGCHSR